MTLPDITKPEPGYYATRLVRRGPEVAARIWMEPPIDPITKEPMDRPPMMLATLGGKPIDPHRLWVMVAGRTIDKAKFDYLSGVKTWAEQHAPDAPEANPKKAVDFNTLKFDF